LERLLYRLSVSPHGANYLLKGALPFSLWHDQQHWPTRHADLLGFGPDGIDTAIPSDLSDAFVGDAMKQGLNSRPSVRAAYA